jgi:hypothetical protein
LISSLQGLKKIWFDPLHLKDIFIFLKELISSHNHNEDILSHYLNNAHGRNDHTLNELMENINYYYMQYNYWREIV